MLQSRCRPRDCCCHNRMVQCSAAWVTQQNIQHKPIIGLSASQYPELPSIGNIDSARNGAARNLHLAANSPPCAQGVRMRAQGTTGIFASAWLLCWYLPPSSTCSAYPTRCPFLQPKLLGHTGLPECTDEAARCKGTIACRRRLGQTAGTRHRGQALCMHSHWSTQCAW